MADFEKRIVGGESSWDRCENDVVDEVQFIICDSAGKNIMVTQTECTHTLPAWFSDNAHYRSMESMNAAASDLFGSRFSFAVLQCVWQASKLFKRDDTCHEIERSIVTLECLQDMEEIPKGFQWVSVTNARMFHSEKEAVQAIKEELDLLDKGVSPNFRVPWSKLGWYRETTRWMQEELSALGFVMSEPVVQLRVSPWGTVLRGNTGKGCFYLKASPCFCDEATINDILSKVAPVLVCKPLAVDKGKRVFISSDYGEQPKDIPSSTAAMRQLMKDLACLQKASVGKLDELCEAGLPMYETGRAAGQLYDLLEHEELSFMKDSSIIQNLKSSKETICAALHKLGQLIDGLPMTLVHGDLRGDNIYRRKDGSGGFGFFDWDSSHIGLPFLDIRKWFDMEDVTESYLEEWQEFQSMSNLKEALTLSRYVGYVFTCLRAFYDLQHMEERCKQHCRSHLGFTLDLLSDSCRYLPKDLACGKK